MISLKTIGIIGAMPIEINLIKDNIEVTEEKEYAGFKFYIGKKESVNIIITSCSIGKVNVASCTQILIDKFQVTHIINTGIAGSLNKDVKICDIVISDKVTHHDVRKEQMQRWHPYKEYFEADRFLIEIAIKAYKKMNLDKYNYHLGKIVTGESFVSDCDLRDLIIKEHSPYCVEMEGASIAQVAYMNKIPFIIIRSISDNADGDPNEYVNFEKIASNNSANLVLNTLYLLNYMDV